MLEGLSPVHLLLVLAIALIVVGPGKLPEVGGAIGKSIREFRRASSGDDSPAPAAPAPAPVAPAPAPFAAPMAPLEPPPAPVMAPPVVAPLLAADPASAPSVPEAPIGSPADEPEPPSVHPAE